MTRFPQLETAALEMIHLLRQGTEGLDRTVRELETNVLRFDPPCGQRTDFFARVRVALIYNAHEQAVVVCTIQRAGEEDPWIAREAIVEVDSQKYIFQFNGNKEDPIPHPTISGPLGAVALRTGT